MSAAPRGPWYHVVWCEVCSAMGIVKCDQIIQRIKCAGCCQPLKIVLITNRLETSYDHQDPPQNG
jgi:hypothetical protein